MAHTTEGGKYLTATTIAAMISRNYKSLDYDIYDVVEWCAEAEKHIGDFEGFQRINNYPVDIVDKKALLPCNIYRLLSVKDNKNTVFNYENNGTFLTFSDNSIASFQQGTNPPDSGTLSLYIDYLGIPVDPNTGYPLIKDGHEEACYWYCLTKLLFEKYMNKDINESQWMFINDRYGHYVQKAKSGFQYVSRDDMDKFAMCVMNMVPKLRIPTHGMK